MNKPSSHSQRKREEGGGGLRVEKKALELPAASQAEFVLHAPHKKIRA